MNDYRGRLCLLDGKRIAKCTVQDFYTETLTFALENGYTFEREGVWGVEVIEELEGLKLTAKVNEEFMAKCSFSCGEFSVSIYKDDEEVFYHELPEFDLKGATLIVQKHLCLGRDQSIYWRLIGRTN